MKLECVDPDAPIEKCLMCGNIVHTCERKIANNNDYRCPVHKEDIQTKHGWFCSEKCYFEYDPL